jgi:lysophospholipase L1-like esterase
MEIASMRCIPAVRTLILAALLGVPTTSGWADDYAIHDGDTVVFLGDSITAARAYGKIVENYTLLRFPQRKVRFINAGRGGDTAAGGLKRLEQDVFVHHATVLIVAYGINDIGWGVHADAAHQRAYLESIKGIVEACKKRGVRAYICSAAVTGADPAKSEDSILQKMCDEGMAVARTGGEHAIDVQRAMRAIQKKVWASNAQVKDESKKDTLHAPDGVHLNDLGQLAMGLAILKGLGAPADVSSVVIDARRSRVLQANGCKVTELAVKDDGLTFTRLDEGLPFNYGIFYALHFRFVPVPEEINRYLLTVMNLPADRYKVRADGRGVGIYTAEQLAAGVNIASATLDGWEPGGPWNAQANVLQALTEARHQIATAGQLAPYYLPQSSLPEILARQGAQANGQIEELQRTAARPQPYHFVVKRYQPPPPKAK